MSTTKCYCCNYRYATEEYSNGFYCTQCASDQPNKGSFVDDHTPMQQLFGRVGPFEKEKYTQCHCCQFFITSQQNIATLFYKCNDSFNFCNDCAPNHKVCPKHPAFGLSQEGLVQLLRLIKNNQE
uniref:Uncharacterized protein n=1 Tax=Amphimedon queenslandica TaxID=400682 RepID=A0A1X7V6L6_AMPQE